MSDLAVRCVNPNISPNGAMNNVQNTNSSVPYYRGNLDYPPDKVSFGKQETNQKKKLSKGQKWLIWGGIAATAILTTVIGVKHFAPVKQIERRFKKLYDDIPGTQKKFKEIFMRENLTEEETLNMLKRYEKIEKDGLKQSKEDYWQAVFEEAKKNYDFDNPDIKLVFKKDLGDKLAGQWLPMGRCVEIKPTIDKKYGFGCIHHELRHAKQAEILKYCSEDDFIRIFGEQNYNWMKNNAPSCIENKTLEEFIKETYYGTNDFSKEMRKNVRETYITATLRKNYMTAEELSKVPKEKRELAQKFLKGLTEARSPEDNIYVYWQNVTEIDARSVEDSINEMILGYNTKWREKLFK